MPEFYEVKRMKNYLLQHGLLGQKIESIHFLNRGERILKNYNAQGLKRCLNGAEIQALQTKAKYTFIQCDVGTMVWHYCFTGIPHIEEQSYEGLLYSIFSLPIIISDTTYSRFEITCQNLRLIYIDTRCLSRFYFYPDTEINETPQFYKVADDLDDFKPEPYGSFIQTYRGKSLILKDWLQNQAIAPSGIGNYLACEICAYSHLHPFRVLHTLSSVEYGYLIEGINSVKRKCEKHANYHWFKVFNREKCSACLSPIHKERFRKNAQTTHMCLSCQQ